MFQEQLGKIRMESNINSERNVNIKNQILNIVSDLQRGVRALTGKDKDIFYISKKIDNDFERLFELLNDQKSALANIHQIVSEIRFPDISFF